MKRIRDFLWLWNQRRKHTIGLETQRAHDRKCRELRTSIEWFMEYVGGDVVTEGDDRAIRCAEQVEEFLTNDWGC